MIANVFYQKDITRRMQSLSSSVSSVPLCEALKTPKVGQNDPVTQRCLTPESCSVPKRLGTL